MERLNDWHIQAAHTGEYGQPAGPEMGMRDVRRLLRPAACQLVTERPQVRSHLVCGQPGGWACGDVLDRHSLGNLCLAR